MLFIRRGCGIHALCLGTDGVRVTEVRSRARTAACPDPKPTRKPLVDEWGFCRTTARKAVYFTLA